MLVEVIEIKSGWGQIFDAWQENGSLELGHRGFKLRRDEGEGLELNPQRLVEIDCFRYEVCVKLVQVVVKQGREVLGQVI